MIAISPEMQKPNRTKPDSEQLQQVWITLTLVGYFYKGLVRIIKSPAIRWIRETVFVEIKEAFQIRKVSHREPFTLQKLQI